MLNKEGKARQDKKGISLITLIITIIIMIILSTAVIISLTGSDIIGQSKKAKVLNEANELQAQLDVYKTEQYMKSPLDFDETTISGKLSEVLGNEYTKYDNDYAVEEGKLIYIGEDETTEEWLGTIDVGTGAVEIVTSLSYESTTNSITATLTTNYPDKIAKYEYSKDGENYQTENTFTGLDVGSTYTLYGRVTDNTSKKNVIDAENQPLEAYTKGAPTPTITLNPATAQGTNGWYTTDVQITINKNTSSSDISTTYQVNENTWVSTPNPFTITEEGTTTINYKNTNTRTGEEVTGTEKIKVDKTAPTAMTVNENRGKTEITATITAGGEDTISGPVTYKYYLNNDLIYTDTTGTVKEYKYIGLNANTSYTVKIEAINEAGLITTYQGTGQNTAEELVTSLSYTATTNTITANLTTNYPERITKYEYSLNGTDYQENNEFTGLASSSTYTIYARVTDSLGGVINATNQPLTAYTKGAPTPTVTLNPVTPQGTNGWYTTDVNVTVNANKTGTTGISTTYQVNDGSWLTTPNPFTTNTEGTITINYKNTNTGTGDEVTKTEVIKVDKTAPTTMTVNENRGKTEITATITAGGEDVISGPVTYKYYLNNNLIQTTTEKTYKYTGLTANTSYTVKIEATNQAGQTTTYQGTGQNTQEELVTSLSYTSTTNTITATLVTNYPERVTKYEYSINGTDYQESNTFTSLNAGSTYAIYARVTDSLGGVIQAANQPLTAYTKGVPTPTLTISSGTLGANDWYTTNVGITINPNKTGTTGITTEYQINGGSWTTGTSYTITTEGTNTVNYRNTNTATGEVDSKTTTIKIDKTKPTASHALNPVSPTTAATVKIIIDTSDSASGIDTITLPNNNVSTEAFIEYDVTENGTYAFKIKDKAGNELIYNVTVDNVSTGIIPTTPTGITITAGSGRRTLLPGMLKAVQLTGVK